ncbi:MAG: hypothetical protein LBN31_07525, partial [Hungatella sp.]|nr:hypothetical protein [Hungatella sp.]
MKKKNLILLLAMTIGLLTACQSGVSKDAYESLENRASQAEEERDALKNSFDELSITHESLKESISIEQESKNSKQETPSMRFDEHIPLNTTDLQAIYDVTNGNNEEMLTAAVLPLVDIGIAPDNMEILGLENFEKITIPDNGKANTGFRVDLIFNTDKYKLSC